MRTFLEHGLYNEALPQKVCYVTSCYRYEKPQAGRLREFHQFGVECFGASGYTADAELISVGGQLFESLGVKNLCLQINSIGCPECRAKYYEALRDYFKSHEQELCGTCLERLERNPMRILDCKSPVCSEIAAHAPVVLDYICDDCRAHFMAVQDYLEAMGIEFMINPTIVRGLDYYTRTVFEFVSSAAGAQATVCGGGRYDGLVKEMGGAGAVPRLCYGSGTFDDAAGKSELRVPRADRVRALPRPNGRRRIQTRGGACPRFARRGLLCADGCCRARTESADEICR